MEISLLGTKNVKIYFNQSTNIFRTVYEGELTPETTIHIYQSMSNVLDFIALKDIRGSIYDFRDVTVFHQGNLRTIQRSSQTANRDYDFSHIPVALVVKNLLQEQMVKVAMKITPQENRKRLVRSEEAALTFIDEWHKTHQETT